MTHDFAEWHRLNRRRETALREGTCTCCAFIHRAGDPGPRPVRAVATWVCKNGNREQLCESCLGIWQENAVGDPEMAALSVRALTGS